MNHSLTKSLTQIALAATILLGAAPFAGAADWYVSSKGKSLGKGSKDSPWDIESALLGKRTVKAGDTLYLLAGTYRRRPNEQFVVQLAGAEKKPIHIRPASNERVIIDGGLTVANPSAHVWVRDLEIIVSEPQPTKPVGPGSHPKDFTRPWGGLNINGGKHCKYINLAIHDCRQGISCWSNAEDTEIHGCIIYDNGWPAVDRGHGHAIYTQNKDGTCVISDCIMTGGHGYSMHAYGSSRAYVDNYLIAGNIAYGAGSFLIGGGKPSHNIRAFNNVLFGTSMQFGYAAPYNEDCEVKDNIIINGALSINKYKKVVKEGNLVLPKDAPRPKSHSILRPNKYDPNRANLVLLNWDKKPAMDVDPGTFLKNGDTYRLLNPRDSFGKAILTGTYDGAPLRVPVAGEFAAFVFLKE